MLRSAAAMNSDRRHHLDGATHGQKADLVALECLRSSFFLLCVRINSSLGSAINSRASPSGSVPGCSGGGGSARRLFIDGSFGLDCVCAISFWVLTVTCRDLVVIFLSCESLYVIVHPPP